MAIQWRPEVNPLTVPHSYRIRFISSKASDENDLADDVAERHPNFNKADILSILNSETEAIKKRLLNGEQITKSGSFSYYPSFTGRLDSPDDPLPPLEECLQINVRVSPPFLAEVRQAAEARRLAMVERLPTIVAAKDSLLELKDVLNPDGVLQLTGDDLSFDRSVPESGECVIKGTQSGRTVQKRLLKVEAREILLMPSIPAQANPWNNEYEVMVSARYSEHGPLRTGSYRCKLRTPLAVRGLGQPDCAVGILTGSASNAYASIIGGTVTGDETVRLQALLDVRNDTLSLSLIDMQEHGRTGTAVNVPSNGEITVPGFDDSAVQSLTVRVNKFAALKELVRNDYGNRLVDVLIVEAT